jgi:predicted NBD/HSP70 family sugar kinase
MADPQVTGGVDLGGTKIQSVMLRDGEVVGSARVLTPQTGAADDVIEAVAGTIHAALEQAAVEPSDLRAIGVGTPGEIDSVAGVVSLAANVPGFADRVELGPRLSESLNGIPVKIDNDVTVGVLGEFKRGAGRPFKNLLGIWVGSGVGGGLVINGELYDGRGTAGEIGHAVVMPDGRPCSCGRRGCLEAYAGRVRMEERARELQKSGKRTILFKVMKERNSARLSSGVFAAALKKGDKMAIQLIDEAAWALGLALASAQNLLDLEAIIVGGGLGDRLGQPFVDQIVEQMTPHLFTPDKPPRMLTTQLGDLGGAVGAAVLAGG